VGLCVGGGIRDVNGIGIFGIDAEFAEVPAALPDASVIRNALPVLRTVVRTVKPAVFLVHNQINVFRIAGRNRNSDATQALGRKSVAIDLFPMIAAVARTI